MRLLPLKKLALMVVVISVRARTSSAMEVLVGLLGLVAPPALWDPLAVLEPLAASVAVLGLGQLAVSSLLLAVLLAALVVVLAVLVAFFLLEDPAALLSICVSCMCYGSSCYATFVYVMCLVFAW
uniref:Uncharacterized protein n=1 Tax=Opuntia streptacantha TaxID=393608 RepID=A0A7C9CJ73_OPUST